MKKIFLLISIFFSIQMIFCGVSKEEIEYEILKGISKKYAEETKKILNLLKRNKSSLFWNNENFNQEEKSDIKKMKNLFSKMIETINNSPENTFNILETIKLYEPEMKIFKESLGDSFDEKFPKSYLDLDTQLFEKLFELHKKVIDENIEMENMVKSLFFTAENQQGIDPYSFRSWNDDNSSSSIFFQSGRQEPIIFGYYFAGQSSGVAPK
jgi:hypothetical protein